MVNLDTGVIQPHSHEYIIFPPLHRYSSLVSHSATLSHHRVPASFDLRRMRRQNLRILHLLLIYSTQLIQMQCETLIYEDFFQIYLLVVFIHCDFPGMKELACFGESEQELNFALRGPVDHYGGSPKPNHLMKDTFYSMRNFPEDILTT